MGVRQASAHAADFVPDQTNPAQDISAGGQGSAEHGQGFGAELGLQAAGDLAEQVNRWSVFAQVLAGQPGVPQARQQRSLTLDADQSHHVELAVQDLDVLVRDDPEFLNRGSELLRVGLRQVCRLGLTCRADTLGQRRIITADDELGVSGQGMVKRLDKETMIVPPLRIR